MTTRRVLASIAAGAVVAASMIGLAAPATAAPGDLTATLVDIGNGTDPAQSSATATVTCDPATHLFSVTVSGIAFPTVGWPNLVEPDTGDDPYILFPTPPGQAIGDVVGGSASASGLSNPGYCVVGNIVRVIGPGNEHFQLDIQGTLQAQSPPAPPPADTTLPVVTQPSNLTVEANRFNGAVVNYATPTATDPVDGSLPVTCTPPSGTLFGVYTTTVQCRATDPAGNTGSASFTVTVVDTTAPVISGVPANLTVDAPLPRSGSTSAPTATVTYVVPTAVDPNRGPVPVSCTPPSGSTFPLGTTTVVCRASDAHGHTTQATFLVTVRRSSAKDLDFAYRTDSRVGGVRGVVGFPTRSGATPNALSVLTLSPEVTVYACATTVRTLAMATSNQGKQDCTKVTSGDGNGAYAVGSLRPGAYNLFGVRGSNAGDLSVGPVAVTVVGGQVKVQDLTLEVPRGGAAVTGTATVTRVPAGVQVSEFLDVFACTGPVHFAGGKPSTRGADTCAAGTVTSPPTLGGRGLDQSSVRYAVGAKVGSQDLYFAYRSDLGILVSPATRLPVSAPVTTKDATFAFPSVPAGGVRGAVRIPTATTGSSPAPSPLAIVTPTDQAEVFACLRNAATTITQARHQVSGRAGDQCQRVESSNRAGAYAVEGLKPDSYNLFAAQATSAGELTVGPVAVTVATGRVVTQDLTLAVPSNAGAVAGTLTVTDVPTGINVTGLTVWACPSGASIDRRGQPSRTGACVKGSAAAPVSGTGRVTAVNSSYQVGVLLATQTWRLFVVADSDIGPSVSDVALTVNGGRLTTQNVSVRFSTGAGLGGVHGTLSTAVPIAAPGTQGAPVTGTAFVAVCDSSIRTPQGAKSDAGTRACTSGSGTLASGYTVSGVTPGSYNLFAVQETAAGLLTAGPVAVTVTRGAVATRNLTLAFDRNKGGLFGTAKVSRLPADVRFIEFLDVWACPRTVTFGSSGEPPPAGGRAGTPDCVKGVVTGRPTVVQPTRSATDVSASYAVGPMAVPPATWQIYVTYRTDIGIITAGPNAQTITAGRFGSG